MPLDYKTARRRSPKKTIQLALHNSTYARWLGGLLNLDGQHRVRLVESPDLTLDGIVVVDELNLDALSPLADPERFVVFAKRTDNLAPLWCAGIRHVVFEDSTLDSVRLTILATELRGA